MAAVHVLIISVDNDLTVAVDVIFTYCGGTSQPFEIEAKFNFLL